MAEEIERAAHLVSSRGAYEHHGLYLGQRKVIHYSGYAVPGVVGKVEIVCLEDFGLGNPIWVKKHGYETYSREQCIERAFSRLNENHYDLFGNNCEHFVMWCIENAHECGQVENGSAFAVGLGGAIGAGAAIGTVAATGAVYGLSASGIMSGLATVGSVVGGGAVAGIGLLAAAPAVITAGVLSRTLYAVNDAQPPSEQAARHTGVAVTATAGVAGGMGTVGAVSLLGSVGGLSGPGIATGLVAIGGSMAGGVVVAAAAPALAAAVIGYCAYKGVARWNRNSDPPPTPKLPAPGEA